MKHAKTAVLFDLDSTLCNTRHRWPLSPISDPDSTWEIYAQACEGDDLVPGIMRALELHWPHHQIHICSNRPESAEKQTIRWLEKHQVKYDFLSLAPKAPAGEREEGTIWCARRKTSYIRELMSRNITPVLFYDDQADMTKIVYQETGVPFVIVNPDYPSTWGHG